MAEETEQVTMPDGQVVALPKNPSPELLARIRGAVVSMKQAKPSGFEEGLKGGLSSLARGAGLAAAGVGEALTTGPLDPATLEPIPSPVIQKFRNWLDKTLPPREGLPARMIEGAGGGIGAPQGLIPRMMAGAMAGGASDITSRFLENQDPRVRQLAATLAGMAAGGATGYLAGPGRARTSEQEATRDTRILTDVALNRIGPRVNTEEVANQAGGAATQVLGNAENSIRGELARTLQGMPRVPIPEVLRAQQNLAAMGRRTPLPEDADAIRQIAAALTSNNRVMQVPGGYAPAPLTAPQDLSLAVKGFKENPPTLSASTGTKISSHAARAATQAAEGQLGRIIPGYDAAMQNYAARMESEVTPLEQGVIGKLAGKRPFEPDPMTPGALGQIISKQSPQAIEETLRQLSQAGGPPAPGGINQQIARALVQEKLAKSPMSPGRTVYGAPESLESQRIDALLRAGGANPERVRQPLEAADLIPQFTKQPSITEYATLSPRTGINLRSIIRPDVFKRMAGRAEYYRQIESLMPTATPQEFQQLQQLSMFDPNIRKLLSAQGALIPLMQGGQ